MNPFTSPSAKNRQMTAKMEPTSLKMKPPRSIYPLFLSLSIQMTAINISNLHFCRSSGPLSARNRWLPTKSCDGDQTCEPHFSSRKVSFVHFDQFCFLLLLHSCLTLIYACTRLCDTYLHTCWLPSVCGPVYEPKLMPFYFHFEFGVYT